MHQDTGTCMSSYPTDDPLTRLISLSVDPFHWPLHTVKLSPTKRHKQDDANCANIPFRPLPCLPPPVQEEWPTLGVSYRPPSSSLTNSSHLLDFSPLRSPNTSFSGQQGPLSPHSKAFLSPRGTGGSGSQALSLIVLEVSPAQELPALLLCGLLLCLC